MRALSDYGVLAHARLIPLYLIGDEILVFQGSDNQTGQVRCISSFSGWAKSIFHKMLGPSRSLLNRNYVTRLAEARFCCKLIPYLRFLDTGNKLHLSASIEYDNTFSELHQQANTLDLYLNNTTINNVIPQQTLARIFLIPSVITSQYIIPLNIDNASGDKNRDITINGIHYRCDYRRTKLLSIAMTELHQAITQLCGTGIMVPNPFINESIELFLNKIEDVILQFNSIQEGNYKIIYHDSNHQVQYRQGNIILVRGPLRTIQTCIPIYIGLPVIGNTRHQHLAVIPHVAVSPQELWSPYCIPKQGGMCPGNRGQYQHLYSDKYTDEEAIVHWLNACCRIVTGQSAVFHSWRKQKGMNPLAPTQPSTRRCIAYARRRRLHIGH